MKVNERETTFITLLLEGHTLTQAAEELGEGSGSTLSVSTGSSVQRAASGAWPATRNIELSASAPR